MLQLLSLHALSAMIIGAGTIYAFRNRRVYTFLFGGLLAYHALMLLSLNGLVSEFGFWSVVHGEVVILVGCICFLTAVAGFELASKSIAARTSGNPVQYAVAQWPAYISLVGLSVLVVVGIVLRRGDLIIEMNWVEFRSRVSFLDSLGALLQFFIFPAVWVAFRARKLGTTVLLLLVTLLIFPILGSRAALLTLPAIVVLDILRSPGSGRRALRVFAVVAPIALVLHITGRFIRALGLGGLLDIASGKLDVGQVVDDALGGADFAGGETEIARYFVFSVTEGPFPDSSVLASVSRWLMMYVPRAVFPEFKAEDVTYVLWRHAANEGFFDGDAYINVVLELLGMGMSGSIHPLLWGEMWLNGGWLAIPISALVLAMIVVGIERAMEHLPPLGVTLVLPATIIGYLMVARGNSVIGLGYTFYLAPIAIAMCLGYGAVSRIARRKVSGIKSGK